MKKNGFLDGGILCFLSRAGDLILLNVLFLLCSLPFITAGASLTAMFYVTLRMSRNEDAYIAKDFFRSFRQNLKQGTVIHLFFSAVSIIIAFDLYVLWKIMAVSWVFKYLLVLLSLLLLLHFMTGLYLYPLLAQFNNTVKNTIKNARYMALKHFPVTMAMTLLCIFPFFCAWFVKHALEWEIVLFGLLGFSLIAYINSRFLVKIFDKYIEEQDA